MMPTCSPSRQRLTTATAAGVQVCCSSSHATYKAHFWPFTATALGQAALSPEQTLSTSHDPRALLMEQHSTAQRSFLCVVHIP